ncbi:MAG: S8 family serine peptidase [Ardenticatenales bacterium]|nr:S8 family serine peptidase [Ardenticatenales bacterium]
MNRRHLASLAVLLLPAFLLLALKLLPIAAAETPEVNEYNKLDASLAEAIAGRPPDALVDVIIHLRDEVDLRPIRHLPQPLARRQALIATLQATAAAAQTSLLADLSARPDAENVRSLWITNAVAARVSVATLAALSARPDIAQITDNTPRQYIQPNDWLPRQSNITTTPEGGSWGINKVRAPLAWYGLGVDGSGITVAIMDSGVDAAHPALSANYRGRDGNDTTSWYDVIDGSATPFDPFGHGTHVAGTAVGGEGLGVAPGAEWIAVRVFNEFGFASDSDIHMGFQWLLAPNGDPALAPDVVNNSWGGAPTDLQFMVDVEMLRDAGILPIFAAGNSGSFAGTISAPASYPDTLAVGATEPDDRVAWFSSRGPSPITGQTRPGLVAPGVNILSTLPDGNYGLNLGTSMATPHVTGAAALVLSADPSLTPFALATVLTETVRPLAAPVPDDNNGYGLLDAYAAVASRLNVGQLVGTVKSQGQPLPQTPVTVTTPAGQSLVYITDDAGQFHAPLLAGNYDVSVTAYAHHDYHHTTHVSDGQTRTLPINLAPYPVAHIQGVIRRADTQAPIANATITVAGTPVSPQSEADGSYQLELRPGAYTLTISAVGYTRQHIPITANLGAPQTIDMLLTPAPRLLLVDSGPWYYESAIGYYEQALVDNDLSYDLWSVHDPYQDAPGLVNLLAYDTVIWSAPFDAPGLLANGSVAVYDYLQRGGNLIISGQDVAWNDAVGYDTEPWFSDGVSARYGGMTTLPYQVMGTEDDGFAGINLSLNGLDSANNQESPDWVLPRTSGRSSTIMTYQDGHTAAVRAGFCQRYRLVYLGFGLESVNGAGARADLLQRSLDMLAQPPQDAGVRFETPLLDDLAPPGSTLTYTVQLRNRSELITDTFDVTINGDGWSTRLITPTLSAGPCQAGKVTFAIDVPATLPPGATHTVQLTAVAHADPAQTDTFYLALKTPAHVLLVDDDRWYDREMAYRQALDGLSVPYDIWDIGWDNNVRGSPSAEVLSAYDIVLWFTGYDWFRPITSAEMQALQTYMAQGGRLFLSSQDYAYYHLHDPLTRDYLGVMDYRESLTPTAVFAGGDPNFLGDLPNAPSGLWPLDYGPYQNFSDGLLPMPGASVFFWHDRGMPGGIANRGEDWRAIFWGLPFETLPVSAQGPAMNRIVGWLSDLGDSTFVAEGRTAAAGSRLAYTLTLRTMDLGRDYQVAITNTLPSGVTLDEGSLTPGLVYDEEEGILRWQGAVPAGSTRELHYATLIDTDLPAGTPLVNAVAIHYEQAGDSPAHELTFTRDVVTWVDAPNYEGVSMTTMPASPRPMKPVTINLTLSAPDPPPTGPITVTLFVPFPLYLLTQTVQSSYSVTIDQTQISWVGELTPTSPLDISLQAVPPPTIATLNVPILALIDDGMTTLVTHETTVRYEPYRVFQPLWLRR